MHAKKLKASQVSGVVLHDRRVGENHANEQIDPARSHLNYNLQIGDPMELYRTRLSELTYREGVRVNTMVSWVVTCPKELIGTEDEKRFFETMYDFLSDRYGWKNVVSAIVHLDETTPHMHYKFIPVVIENGVEKLNAKKVIYRSELSKVHRDAEAHCQKVFGLNKLILNGATANGNKTITELKLKDLEKELAVKKDTLEAVVSKVEALNEDLPAEKPLYEPKKGLLGSVVTVKAHNALINEFNGLLALERDRQRSVNLWKSRFNDETRRFKALESDFNEFKGLDMPKEVLRLRDENKSLRGEIRSLKDERSFLQVKLEEVSNELSNWKDFIDELYGNLVEASTEFLNELMAFMPLKGFAALREVFRIREGNDQERG